MALLLWSVYLYHTLIALQASFVSFKHCFPKQGTRECKPASVHNKIPNTVLGDNICELKEFLSPIPIHTSADNRVLNTVFGDKDPRVGESLSSIPVHT